MSSTLEVGRARVEELSHHGVLGMKWGHSKGGGGSTRVARSPVPVHAHGVVGRTRFAKTKVVATGGENHPAHEHAIAAEVIRQKLHSSGSVTLSNHELQTLATRGNLEQQVRTLESKRPQSIGQKFVNKLTSQVSDDPVGTAKKAKAGFDMIKKLKTA